VVTPLRIAFFGTPAFALATLERLVRSTHEVDVVVTQPDRPSGRGLRVRPGPVKSFALDHNLPLLQPDQVRDDAFLAAFADRHVDLAVVAAYGRILPSSLLAMPRLGTINVHASLLPRWRGAAPVHRAILAGDAETGVTIMRVVPALDAGPMLARIRTPIGQTETSAALEERLAALGAELLVATVDRLSTGAIPEEPQNDADATYAARLRRADSRLDWERPARDVHNRIRGLQPWPVATVLLRGRRLRLFGSDIAGESDVGKPPGTVVHVRAGAFIVACRPGGVAISRVQLEGRAPLSSPEFVQGHRLIAGERLDPLPIDS
jgi:methionyl-tRNA formyltransferase